MRKSAIVGRGGCAGAVLRGLRRPGERGHEIPRGGYGRQTCFVVAGSPKRERTRQVVPAGHSGAFKAGVQVRAQLPPEPMAGSPTQKVGAKPG
jgi:hypothetical protein